jgi:proline iminopeptidase
MANRPACLFPLVLLTLLLSSAELVADQPTGPLLREGEYTVELNGMKLWFKVSGAGPVCLMPTPAWGPSSDLYFRTLKSMERTFTIVYIDSRGTGRSGKAKTLQEYKWDHLVGDLEAMRAYLRQEKVWLMGHSEGGEQVLKYAATHPGRVSGLVLLSTGAVLDGKRKADVRKRMASRKGERWYSEAARAFEMNPRTDQEMTQMLEATLPFYWSDPKKAESFQDDFAASSVSVVAFAGATASERTQFDVRSELKKVTAPALIVVGEDDFMCSPESATILHLALPNSKLLLIEDAGHFPWMEQPEVFNTRVPEFLAAMNVPGK